VAYSSLARPAQPAGRLRSSLPAQTRRQLERIGKGVDAIMFSESIEAEGALVFAKACEMGLERIVSKRIGSRYFSGPSRLTAKNPAFSR
jgi:ATP-dependent DNA ligase